MFKSSLVCFFFCLLLSTFCLSSDAPTARIEQLSAGLQRCQLDNGLVCLIKEDKAAPLVSIQIWVGSGSAQEEEYLGGGLAHLIEHMIFKGTPGRKPSEIAGQISAAGGAINAYTSFDRTVFFVDMPAEAWEIGLDVLTDAVLNASFPEDEWRREKDVVRREMAMNNDNPDNVVSKLLWQTAFLAHPYRFPVIGCLEFFDGFKRNDLIIFFRRNYTPDNMIIAVVGNISAPKVKEAINEKFQSVTHARRPVALPRELPQISPRAARKTGAYNISRLEMAWHTVGLSHPDAPALDVLAMIAGSGKSARLKQRIKEAQKLCFDIEAWSFTPKEEGLFGISAKFNPTNETALIKAIEDEVASWRTGDSENATATRSTKKKDTKQEGCHSRGSGNPEQKKYLDSHFHGNDKNGTDEGRLEINSFAAAEVEKARNQAIADTLIQFQTMHGKADTFASGEFYAGTPDYFKIYLQRLAEVAPASLTAVAQKYLTDHNRTLAILAPAQTNAAAETQEAAGPEIKVEKTVLPNGLTLLCREDKRLPFVYICVASLGGLLAENEKVNGITCLMAELLTRGTERYTQEKIAELVERQGGALAPFSGMNSYGLQARCFSKDFEQFMDIIADCRLKTSFPEEEIKKCKIVQSAKIEQEHESPFFLGQEAVRKALFPGHPYGMNLEGTRASVMAITRADILRLHHETTASSNTVIAVFGAIAPEEAKKIAEKYFANMPAGARQEWKKFTHDDKPSLCHSRASGNPEKIHSDPGFPIKSGMTNIDRSRLPRRIELTAPREQAIVLFGLQGLAVADKRMDAFNILLSALNGLSSDLMINVRDKKGLAYYTGAYQKAGLAGGQFVVYAGTRAEQAHNICGLIEKEMKRICGHGIRPDELERAKKEIITERRQTQQSDERLAMECALNELYGLGYAYGLETEKRMEQTTTDDVRRAAAEIIRMEDAVEVIVRPEK